MAKVVSTHKLNTENVTANKNRVNSLLVQIKNDGAKRRHYAII
jgi:hypothetical protein